jgi:hypothetical protein
MNLSLLKLQQPFPPLPALKVTTALSTNMISKGFPDRTVRPRTVCHVLSVVLPTPTEEFIFPGEFKLIGINLDKFFIISVNESDSTRFQGEQSVVLADPDIFPRFESGSPLPDND